MMFRLFVAALLLAAAMLLTLRAGLGRDLLGVTVRACVLDHDLLNAAAPCLLVDTANGHDAGYAILRGPADESHFILTPTKAIVGIEAPELRRLGTPNYVALAWAHRRLAYPTGRALPDDDMALAINSQRGRTQDQLHIHVDCPLPEVKRRLSEVAPSLRTGQWKPVKLDKAAPYWVTLLRGLSDVNVIDLAASFLKLSEREMPQLTLAVFDARGDGPERFILVARQHRFKQHAELLLDHDCEAHTQRFGPGGHDATLNQFLWTARGDLVRQLSGVAPAADRPFASPKSG